MMKRIWQISIAAAITAVVVLVIVFASGKSRETRHETTCTGLEINVLDTVRVNFVSKKEVKAIIDKEYGVYMGQRLDSVNLSKVESLLDGRNAILKSEAYVTRDGVLHVDVTQRDPVLRFVTEDGSFFSDATGFIFPMNKPYDGKVCEIDGRGPLRLASGYRGVPEAKDEKKWLDGAIDLASYISGKKEWSEKFSSIRADDKGKIVIMPVNGKEKFIFGFPENFEDKFRKIDDYYTYIAPKKEEGYYSTVDVRYAGQIVCRQ